MPVTQNTPPPYLNLREHFIRLEGAPPTNIYEWMLTEIESPLLETVLQYARKNQSVAARWLNISRGTLRKKMQRYGLLQSKNKEKR